MRFEEITIISTVENKQFLEHLFHKTFSGLKTMCYGLVMIGIEEKATNNTYRHSVCPENE